jgi:UDP-3-O-acyl N-acetylglucosamine deacetylase
MYTLTQDIQIKGVGMHSGEPVTMVVGPSHVEGIHIDYAGVSIPVHIRSVGDEHLRSTKLEKDGVQVHTPEHFLAACFGLQLTQINVQLSAAEFPIIDGSAQGFVDAFIDYRKAVDCEQKVLKVDTVERLDVGGSTYIAMPYDGCKVTCFIDYPDRWVGSMVYNYDHSEQNFVDALAPARTYGFMDEVDALRARGLAKGGSLDNALVVTEEGYLNEPRFGDEMVRHKVLDFIGDMAIGFDTIQGSFIICAPSHQHNVSFLNYIHSH